MNLIIDVGNTRTKAAVFSGDKLLASKIFEGEAAIPALKRFLTGRKIDSAILCSVIDHSVELKRFLSAYNYIEFSENTRIPVKNLYKTPKTLGKDRLANAIGANCLFPGKNLLVTDAGTCIKYDFVNSKSEYLGGAISPGLDMRFRALHHFTAHLPELRKIKTGKVLLIGQTTKDSILSGVQNGAAAEISGIIKRYREKYKNVHVIITGGDGRFFNDLVSEKNRIFAAPDLTLLGLNAILNFNNAFV